MKCHSVALGTWNQTAMNIRRSVCTMAAAATMIYFAAFSAPAVSQEIDAKKYRWPDGMNAVHTGNLKFFREGNIETKVTRLGYGVGFYSALGLQCKLFTESDLTAQYALTGAIWGIYNGEPFNPGSVGDKDANIFLYAHGCTSPKVREMFGFLRAATFLGPENPNAPF